MKQSDMKQSEIRMNLASDKALKTLTAQVRACLRLPHAGLWPQVRPMYIEELLREVVYWRASAGLLERIDE